MTKRKGLGDRKARHDAAYLRAKEENFASRAVYKLEALDKRFRLFRPGHRVLDLGCWPGSWLQYIQTRIQEDGVAVGIDLKEVTLSLGSNVTTHIGDVYKLNPNKLLQKYGPFNAVVSDMAPHTTGDREGDLWRSEELFLHALHIARQMLRPGGHFCAKVFQGGRFRELLNEVQRDFQEYKAVRSPHSRKLSREQYVVGRGLRATSTRPEEGKS